MSSLKVEHVSIDEMKQIRVLIVDDHVVVRQGIRMIVNTEPTIKVVGEAKNGQQAIDQIEQLQPDVVLMDIVMPGEDGIRTTGKIKDDHPNVKIIMLTTFEDDEKIDAAMEVGADGYLFKDADGESLLQAIQAVQRGEMPLHPRVARYLVKGGSTHSDNGKIERLTEREKEVLCFVAKGWSNKEVANALSLTEGTVKVHVSNVLGKLNVSSRTEAAVLAAQVGLVSIDQED